MALTYSANLRSLLESLPQEIYDEIYHLTFTPKSAITQIHPWYRPASESQVNKATRKLFKGALHRSTFVGHVKHVSMWLESLGYVRSSRMPVKIRCWAMYWVMRQDNGEPWPAYDFERFECSEGADLLCHCVRHFDDVQVVTYNDIALDLVEGKIDEDIVSDHVLQVQRGESSYWCY